MSEQDALRAIQLAATQRGHRLWRNNSAQGWAGRLVRRNPSGLTVLADARPLHAGLAPGSSDLIGLATVRITDDMVGTTIGRFLSIEVKSDCGRLTNEQRAWIEMIQARGGLAGEARSVDDLERILNL